MNQDYASLPRPAGEYTEYGVAWESDQGLTHVRDEAFGIPCTDWEHASRAAQAVRRAYPSGVHHHDVRVVQRPVQVGEWQDVVPVV